MLVSLDLPLIQPALVVLGEYVSGWGDVILHAMTPSHFENIPPEVVFPPELPAARKVVDFLILINIFKFPWLDYSSPEDVPCWAGDQAEPRSLQRIHHTVVGMSWAIYLEAKERVGLQVILSDSL